MYVLIFRTIFGYDTMTFENHIDMLDFLKNREKVIITFSFTYKQSNRKRI
jgi:hypothetical protein